MSTTSINLDLVINQADSAKTLKETRLAIRDLQNAALEVGQGNKGFVELITKAGELKDRVNDIRDSTKVLAGSTLENLTSSFTTFSRSAIGGFQAIIGAQAAFGSQSKELQATLVQLQGLLNLSQGLKEVGNIGQSYKDFRTVIASTIEKIVAMTAVDEASLAVREETVVATGAQTTATGAQTVATEGATVAQVGLNAAMLANPIAIVVVALAAAALAFTYFSNKSQEAKKNQAELFASLVDNANKLNDSSSNISKGAHNIDLITGATDKYTKSIKDLNTELLNKQLAYNNNYEKDKINFLSADKNNEERLAELDKRSAMLKYAENNKFTKDLIDLNRQAVADYQNKYPEVAKYVTNRDNNFTQIKQAAKETSNAIEQVEAQKLIDIQNSNVEKSISATKFASDSITAIQRDIHKKAIAENDASYQEESSKIKYQLSQKRITNEEAAKQEADALHKYYIAKEVEDQRYADSSEALRLGTLASSYKILELKLNGEYDILKSGYGHQLDLIEQNRVEAIRINKDGAAGETKIKKDAALAKLEAEKKYIDDSNALINKTKQENFNKSEQDVKDQIKSGIYSPNSVKLMEDRARTAAFGIFDASQEGKRLAELKNKPNLSDTETSEFRSLSGNRDLIGKKADDSTEGLSNQAKNSPLDDKLTSNQSSQYSLQLGQLDRFHKNALASKRHYYDELLKLQVDAIRVQAQKDINAITDTGKKKEVEEKKINSKAAVDIKNLEKDNKKSKQDAFDETAKSYADGISSLTDSIGSIYSSFDKLQNQNKNLSQAEQEKRAKQNFGVQKALMLSLAVPQAAMNILGAWEGIGKSVDPISKGIAIANLVATTAAGVLNVAAIANSQYKSTAQSAPNTPPPINLYGQGNNTNNLSAQNNNMNQQIRTFVLESDITTAQTNVARYKTSSQLG